MKKDKVYRFISLLAILILIISMIPVFYLTFYNYATGDDINIASWTHVAVMEGRSASEVVKAAWDGVKSFYYGWGGNWSACILWAIEPSVWGEDVYHITGYIALFFILGGSGILLWYINKKFLNGSKMLFTIVFSLYSFLIIQWIPAGHTAIFWFAVVANYIIPYGLMLFSIKWIDKYLETSQTRFLVYSGLALIFIGGAGLMTVVVSFEILFLFICYTFFYKKSRFKGLGLLIVMVLFLLSAGANVLAPGNSVRAGGELSFGVSDIFGTVLESIVRGTQNAGQYFIYSRFLWLYVPLIVLLSWEFIDAKECAIKFRFPGLFIAVTYLMYCSAYAPMAFMKDIDGSSGHTNIYWFLFTLWITISVGYVVGYLKEKDININKLILNTVRVGCVLLVILSCLMYRHFIGNMFGYKCLQYAKSGALADYEMQMQERFEILANSDDGDIVLPQMNDDQGPFLHFAVTDDPENYTSYVTAHFYGKKSVIAIPRDEYYQGD